MRPPDLEFGADDKPPLATMFLLGLQHTGIVATAFVFPILVARAAGLEAGAAAFFVSMSMLAIILNLVMLIGVKQRITATLDTAGRISDQVFTLMERQGEAWAARGEVIHRMAMALTQVCELVTDEARTSGPVTVAVSFDEYNLDAEVSYTGTLLPLPEKRPSEEDILNDPSAMLLLGGYLVRSQADRASSSASGGLAVLKIHMEH